MDLQIPTQKKQSQFALQALIHVLKPLGAFILFVITFFAGFHIAILICTLLWFIYLAFLCYQESAYSAIVKYYKRAIQFKTIHTFFEEMQTDDNELPIKSFFEGMDEEGPGNQLFDTIMEDVMNTPKYYSAFYAFKYYLHPGKPKDYSRAKEEAYISEYEAVREKYKQSFEELFGKEAKREQFEKKLVRYRNFYLNRVTQLLQMNKSNLEKLKQELQKNYLIKILQKENYKRQPELTNITLDQAIFAAVRLPQKQFPLPWIERPDRSQSEVKTHLYNLQKIGRDRKQIDKLLSPYYPLNQKTRTQVVAALEHQISRPGNARSELVYTVIEIFNDKLRTVNNSEKYLIFKKDITIRPSFQLVQTNTWKQLHVDLMLKREGKEQKYVCNPGDNNLWTLLAFAVEVIRRKM